MGLFNKIKPGRWFGKGKREVRKLGGKAEDVAQLSKREIEDAVTGALQEIFSQASRAAFAQSLSMIDFLAPERMDSGLGNVKFSINAIPDKIETIKKWMHNPPGSKKGLLRMVDEIVADNDEVGIYIGGRVPLVQFAGEITLWYNKANAKRVFKKFL